MSESPYCPGCGGDVVLGGSSTECPSCGRLACAECVQVDPSCPACGTKLPSVSASEHPRVVVPTPPVPGGPLPSGGIPSPQVARANPRKVAAIATFVLAMLVSLALAVALFLAPLLLTV